MLKVRSWTKIQIFKLICFHFQIFSFIFRSIHRSLLSIEWNNKFYIKVFTTNGKETAKENKKERVADEWSTAKIPKFDFNNVIKDTFSMSISNQKLRFVFPFVFFSFALCRNPKWNERIKTFNLGSRWQHLGHDYIISIDLLFYIVLFMLFKNENPFISNGSDGL